MNPPGPVKKYWPLIGGLGIFGLTILVLTVLSLRLTQGHFIYMLDDAYIHMAMAKNFARGGVWGVAGSGFTPSSSSPLWTMLLAVFYLIFGVRELIPFLLNALFGSLILVAVYAAIRNHGKRQFLEFIVLIAVIFLTPLPSLIFCGQEHTLHVLLAILFAMAAARVIAQDHTRGNEYPALLALALLLGGIRYESLFIAAAVGVVLAGRKKFLAALALPAVTALPALVYGIISVKHGYFFLPNSLLLKGTVPNLATMRGVISFLDYPLLQQVLNPHILLLILGALMLYIQGFDVKRPLPREVSALIAIFVAAALLHLFFVSASYFFRYEAYLIALGILAVGLGLIHYRSDRDPGRPTAPPIRRRVALILLVIFLLSPITRRGLIILLNTPRATKNIYEQQYQMARFIKEYYPAAAVAANDIGAITFFRTGRILDLWGLSNGDVARRKMAGTYGPAWIEREARRLDVKIAVAYEEWFFGYGGLPKEWIKVAQWQIPDNFICASDVVTFYAVDPNEKDNLIANLRAFSSTLPRGVRKYGYID
jgi:hypothetical protein